jgi:hypothetical protein
MAFQRATCQSRRSLREHYEAEANGSDPHVAPAARLMIQLIERLETTFQDRSVWGLTSLYHLKLLAADDWKTPWYVSIAPAVSGRFAIEYLLPEGEAPWPNARVLGESESVEAAVDMILLAMQKSRGWTK